MFTQILFSLALLTASSAYAAEGTSEASQSTTSSSILDNFHMGLFSIFHGPGVTNLDKPFTPNADGITNTKNTKNTAAMSFDSELNASYMLTKTIGIGPVMPFYLYPVMGKGFSLGDVGFRAFNRKFYSTHDLNIYANLIFQLPTSEYSSLPSRDMKLGVKMTPNIRYSIPSTRYTIGAWTEQKAYLGVVSGKTTKLYAAPYVNYQVTPSFSWNLEFEAEADHMYGKPTWDLTMYQTDVMPGFVYMVTPQIIVNPYFQIFTSQKVSMQNTALGATLSASL